MAIALPQSLGRVVNVWMFVQNEVEQGFIDLQLAVVVDQAQLPKLVHEYIHASTGRSYQRRKRILVDPHG